MTTITSDCLSSFGYEDFDVHRVEKDYPKVCPVRGCSTRPVEIMEGSRNVVCPRHGIELHQSTFVYWNGEGEKQKARLRNFRFRQDLAAAVALGSTKKAENHRLGHEMSEDALSWNVFVGLAEAQALRGVVHWLTGVDCGEEPRLYLWGELIDLSGKARERFAPLGDIRKRLETGIRKFQTEPDIMLVAPGKLLVCIEAKFGSSTGNTLAHETRAAEDEKPTDIPGLLRRYLDRAREHTRRSIDRTAIGSRLHSQLFRNIIFASEMAAQGENWHVVNLVSATQWKQGRESAQHAFHDPTPDVQAYLTPDRRHCFTYRTWEQLYADVIHGHDRLSDLGAYLRWKSAHFRPAFNLVA